MMPIKHQDQTMLVFMYCQMLLKEIITEYMVL